LQNIFFSVFELPSLRNTRKRDKTKKVEEKLTSKFLSIFWKKFLTWTFYKNIFNGVFELPLPRNAQKRTNQKIKKNKSRMVGGWVWDLENVRGGPSIVDFLGPAPRSAARQWRQETRRLCALRSSRRGLSSGHIVIIPAYRQYRPTGYVDSSVRDVVRRTAHLLPKDAAG
jgi:hypothetical protein